MILDNLHTTLTDYGAVNPKIARAMEWLKGQDLKSLEPDQVITVDGERIKAQIQAYNTQEASAGLFEAHRLFIDIQIMVSGEETMLWVPLARLPEVHTPYDYVKDVVFFQEPAWSVPLRMGEGDFVIFFPSDGHKPKCQADKPEAVRKIVVKIAV